MHVDDFIDMNYGEENYARWVLMHFRLSATLSCDFSQFMEDKKLFCKYEDRVYRVIGASRMGDIWLCKDFDAINGYDLRVDVDDCSEWLDNCGDAVSEPKPKPRDIQSEVEYTYERVPQMEISSKDKKQWSKQRKQRRKKVVGGLEY